MKPQCLHGDAAVPTASAQAHRPAHCTRRADHRARPHSDFNSQNSEKTPATATAAPADDDNNDDEARGTVFENTLQWRRSLQVSAAGVS